MDLKNAAVTKNTQITAMYYVGHIIPFAKKD